jgi:hypothetical protein
MYLEALTRVHDADLLDRSCQSQSNASALIRILAFEVLLKAAILHHGQEPKPSHNYAKLWKGLPGSVQKQLLAFAQVRMSGHTDFSNLEALLQSFQVTFERARYGYEPLEGYSLDEQRELERIWLEGGAEPSDALFSHRPLELICLVEALTDHIGHDL